MAVSHTEESEKDSALEKIQLLTKSNFKFQDTDMYTKITYIVIQSKTVIALVILNDQCNGLDEELQMQYNQKYYMTACKTILPVLL